MSKASCFIPFGSFQSKWYNNIASGKLNIGTAKSYSRHIHRPEPNAMYSKLFTWKFIEESRNLSRIKLSGSVQYFGSLRMAYASIMSLALDGISNPLILRFSLHSFGNHKEPGGCNLRVSLITSFRNCNSLMPVSSTFPFLLKTSLTSPWTLFGTLGFFIIDSALSMAMADESVPATKISWKWIWCMVKSTCKDEVSEKIILLIYEDFFLKYDNHSNQASGDN